MVSFSGLSRIGMIVMGSALLVVPRGERQLQEPAGDAEDHVSKAKR
jgi:hypothetical protein